MGKIHRVIMFGNSVILAGIKTSIGLDRRCEAIVCEQTTSLLELTALHPDVLIFELNSVQGEFLYHLSSEMPGLLLIGIDPETNRAMFWSCQEASEVTAHDLTRAIHQTGKTGPLGLLKKAMKHSQGAYTL